MRKKFQAFSMRSVWPRYATAANLNGWSDWVGWGVKLFRRTRAFVWHALSRGIYLLNKSAIENFKNFEKIWKFGAADRRPAPHWSKLKFFVKAFVEEIQADNVAPKSARSVDPFGGASAANWPFSTNFRFFQIFGFIRSPDRRIKSF